MSHRKHLVTGFPMQYLGLTAAKTSVPVGVMTVRPDPASFASASLVFDRATLERLREDIDFLLNNSPILAEGSPMDVSLAHLEFVVHPKLTE